MRRLAVAAALAAVAWLPGCSLTTDVASDVSQTSARLNAYGRTGDAQGWFHFEYARREHQLGTARAGRTPERGPIPPETPPAGAAHVSETVDGLSPGRVYVFRVCARQEAMTSSVCAQVRSFFTRPTDAQDWVSFSSYGDDANLSFLRVDAAASPRGRRADGLLFDLMDRQQLFEGRVTCLRVAGDRATIGAVGRFDAQTFDDEPPVPATELVTVVDDPAGDPVRDAVRRVTRSVGTTPPDCRSGTFTGPPLLEGFSTVHDAA
jgi:hypothetical protein